MSKSCKNFKLQFPAGVTACICKNMLVFVQRLTMLQKIVNGSSISLHSFDFVLKTTPASIMIKSTGKR